MARPPVLAASESVCDCAFGTVSRALRLPPVVQCPGGLPHSPDCDVIKTRKRVALGMTETREGVTHEVNKH